MKTLPLPRPAQSLDMSILPVQVQAVIEKLNQVSPALNAWLQEAHRKGAHPDDMTVALTSAGQPLELAAFVAHLARQGLFVQRASEASIDPRLIPRSRSGSPSVPFAREHVLDLGDRKVRRLMSMGAPEVVLYEDFLSDEECEFLKSAVAGKMTRSGVVGRNFSNETSGVRTSHGAFLRVGSHPVIRAIEDRVARLSGVPVSHGEGLQVLHYQNTEEYQPHYDFFEVGTPDEVQALSASGNRTTTVIFYLHDPEEGGATYFPKIDLAIHPCKRTALWFRYLGADGVLDQRTEHAGLPVLKGDKWIATKWLRERPFPLPPRVEGDDGIVIKTS